MQCTFRKHLCRVWDGACLMHTTHTLHTLTCCMPYVQPCRMRSLAHTLWAFSASLSTMASWVDASLMWLRSIGAGLYPQESSYLTAEHTLTHPYAIPLDQPTLTTRLEEQVLYGRVWESPTTELSFIKLCVGSALSVSAPQNPKNILIMNIKVVSLRSSSVWLNCFISRCSYAGSELLTGALTHPSVKCVMVDHWSCVGRGVHTFINEL